MNPRTIVDDPFFWSAFLYSVVCTLSALDALLPISTVWGLIGLILPLVWYPLVLGGMALFIVGLAAARQRTTS